MPKIIASSLHSADRQHVEARIVRRGKGSQDPWVLPRDCASGCLDNLLLGSRLTFDVQKSYYTMKELQKALLASTVSNCR